MQQASVDRSRAFLTKRNKGKAAHEKPFAKIYQGRRGLPESQAITPSQGANRPAHWMPGRRPELELGRRFLSISAQMAKLTIPIGFLWLSGEVARCTRAFIEFIL